MKTSDVTPGFLGAAAATVSMITMRYRVIFIPAGIIGVSLGWVLYLRERRRCNSLGCRLEGRGLCRHASVEYAHRLFGYSA